MKKLITFVAVLSMLLPLSAMAMTPVSDSELADVTGQVGISIAVVDFQMDMTIGNISWSDTDTEASAGAMYIAGSSVDYTLGYININAVSMDNIFVTLNGVHKTVGGTNYLAYADPLLIDVASLGPATTAGQIFASPYVTSKTAIVITMGDTHIQIERITVGGIYLASYKYEHQGYAFNSLTDEFDCTPFTPVDTENLGDIQIDCIDIVIYSSVDGYNTDGSKFFPNNPGRVYIIAH